MELMAKHNEGVDMVATTAVLRAKSGRAALQNEYERGCLVIGLRGGLHMERTASSNLATDKCKRRRFCDAEVETASHMFLRCP
eukprot:5419265-Alexandrium_andersonii.AAC.1